MLFQLSRPSHSKASLLLLLLSATHLQELTGTLELIRLLRNKNHYSGRIRMECKKGPRQWPGDVVIMVKGKPGGR